MSKNGTPDLDSIVTDIAAEIEAEAMRIEEAADAKEPGLKPGPFGIAVTMRNGERFCTGAAATPFPLQSIAKVFALEIVLCAIGDDIFKRVGREPSGDPFNSIVDLERTDGIPRNPFVNAGALVIVDALIGARFAHDFVIDLVVRELGRPVALDETVLESEQQAGDLNALW